MSISLEELLGLPTSHIPRYNEKPTEDQLRTRAQLHFEDTAVGMELPKYIYRPTPP